MILRQKSTHMHIRQPDDEAVSVGYDPEDWSQAMRVVLLNFGGDFSQLSTPDAVLDALRTLTGWATGLAAAGAEVIVVQGFARAARLERRGVRYEFVAGPFSPYLARWRIPWRLLWRVRQLDPQVIHLNGLLYGVSARVLRALLPRDCPLVLQHHGEMPGRPWAGITRWGLDAADAFLFTGRATARPWLDAGLISNLAKMYEIPEGSSDLACTPRAQARALTGMHGAPIFFWAGNLDPNKDPLTVLAGLEPILVEHPDARFYLAFRHDSLLGAVRQKIAASPALERAVELLGGLPYSQLGPYFNSADVFVQGSHREGSGFALLDALACGVIPVVTDIPSFRFLMGDRVGALWPPGDAHALTHAVRQVLAQPLEPQSQAAHERFRAHLSFAAIGQQAHAVYQELREQRWRRLRAR